MKKNIFKMLFLALPLFAFFSCSDDDDSVDKFSITEIQIDGSMATRNIYTGVDAGAPFTLNFSDPVDVSTVAGNIELLNSKNSKVALSFVYEDGDKTIIVQPKKELKMFSDYRLNIWPALKSAKGTILDSGRSIEIATAIDSTNKFPLISDDELLTLVQKQTFKYFWEFGHPTSGMARERSTSGDIVTTGGTGFGIMAMLVASERGFVTRQEAAARVQKIVTFLKSKCTNYHGAYAHWINGSTGATIPFGTQDNGADLVETSFLFQGLLTARQYFNEAGSDEQKLRSDIKQLWEALDWNWFQKEGENVLYWHWSPTYGWAMNMPIRGWSEGLMAYVLAASSPTHSITKAVYDQGWARNGNMKNGESYYGYILPLGEPYGGPMFFSHYSFLGLRPAGLSDAYANYWTQVTHHTLINNSYCIDNPKRYNGYSKDCWGLTASDGNGGYSAHSPTNDKGVIAPTAALASMPYTPTESMRALHFYYYKMGDLLWKEYGFVDALNPSAGWYDDQFLAIDQGPIIVMIENYRTGLLWNLFMSCPEVQMGLKKLGFSYSN